MQCALGGTDSDAFQARGAFGGFDGDEFVDRQRRRAGMGALGAVDARRFHAPDTERAGQGSQSQQSSVGAEIAAPEILYEDGSDHQNAKDDGSGLAEIAEEVQHPDIGNHAVRAPHELFDGRSRHIGDGPGEEGEQEVFQAAQRKIEPAREMEVAAKELASGTPEIFRHCSDWAEPTAKGFAEQERDGQKREKQKQGRRMRRRNVASADPVFEVHQPGDGEPAFDSGGACKVASGSSFEITHPKVKRNSHPCIQQQERELEYATEQWRTVGCGSADKFLA